MKLLVWNINQRSRGIVIPEFVSKEILKLNEPEDPQSYPDIVVLTESISAVNEKNIQNIQNFINVGKDGNSLREKYDYYYNIERKDANSILIAVKKEFMRNSNVKIISKVEKIETNKIENYQPNFLQLNIEVNEKPISIIGTRIRVDLKKSNSKSQAIRREEYKQRHEQLLSLIDHINALKNINVIIAGDFNNAYIRGDESRFYLGEDGVRESYHYTSRGELSDLYDTYNYHIMKDDFAKIGMTVFTPPGKQYSCGFNLYGDKPSNGFLKEDHIITTKNLKVENSRYCHSFIEDYKRDKEWERRWNRQKKKYEYVIVEAYPDHAILTADVDL